MRTKEDTFCQLWNHFQSQDLPRPQQLIKIHLPQYDTFQQQWPLDPHLKINQIKHAIYHKMYSLWALVGDSGGSPGLENALKRWVGPIWPICFSVYFNASLYFFNYEQPREIHGLVHRSKMQARWKCMSELVTNIRASLWKPPHGVGQHCDMAVSPSRSHLLWLLELIWTQMKEKFKALWWIRKSETWFLQ